MSLNDTPSGERIHIGFFGRRNAGKSSVVNAVTGQDLAVVSQVEGTTTDPVKKAMELLPLGPVVIIDTPGFDDEGMLGELRVKKTRQILAQTDLAILVVDGTRGLCDCDRELLGLFEERKIPCIIANNKSDLLQEKTDGNVQAEKQLFSGDLQGTGKTLISVSAKTGDGIYALKEKIADYGVSEEDFLSTLDEMTEQAFDDQCTGANPRYPLMSEIKQMYLNAYYGRHEVV